MSKTTTTPASAGRAVCHISGSGLSVKNYPPVKPLLTAARPPSVEVLHSCDPSDASEKRVGKVPKEARPGRPGLSWCARAHEFVPGISRRAKNDAERMGRLPRGPCMERRRAHKKWSGRGSGPLVSGMVPTLPEGAMSLSGVARICSVCARWCWWKDASSRATCSLRCQRRRIDGGDTP